MAAGRQTPPAVTAQPAGPTPKFSANSNLVIVDVTVKDKAGNAIDSLDKNDFIVLEDGHPQKVDIFEHQKLTLEPEPPDPPPALEDKNELPPPPKTTISSEGATRISTTTGACWPSSSISRTCRSRTSSAPRTPP